MPRWVSRTAVGIDEDDGDDEAGRVAEAEQGQHRDQVDEGRQRLHQVEDRQQDAVDLRLVRGPDADRHADRHGGGGGRDDQHQRLDRLLPQALVEDEEQADGEADGEPVDRCRHQASRLARTTTETGGTNNTRSMTPSRRK